MRRWIGWILFLCLLAGGSVVCAIRWEAWFGNPPEPKWEGDTITYSFSTFADENIREELQTDTLEFLLLGDIHNSLSSDDMSVLIDRHPETDFWVQLGDWMERPYWYYEQMMYHSLLDTGLDSLPIIAVPGNHEYLKGIVKTLPERWKEIFPNPQNGPTRFLGTSYYVDFPYLRIIAIDTDGLHRMSDYTQVIFWLNQTIRAAEDKFTIVVMHHPVYSTAQGRQNPLIWLAFHAAMREADVVFSGHDHNYARSTKQYKGRFWTDETPTVFITTNASNKKYLVKEKKEYDYSFTGAPVYEHIYLTPDTLYIRTYSISDTIKYPAEIDKVLIPRK